MTTCKREGHGKTFMPMHAKFISKGLVRSSSAPFRNYASLTWIPLDFTASELIMASVMKTPNTSSKL